MEGDVRRARIRAILDAGGPDIVVQPVADLRRGTIVGVEALARFATEPRRTPDLWFAEAWSVGLGLELELVAVARALSLLPLLPPDTYIAINASPATLESAELLALVAAAGGHRVVVELTEHAAVDNYDRLNCAVARLRSHGARLAVDDAGAGFATFQHVLRLQPDIIKLDRSLTFEVDDDPVRAALAAALVTFARSLGASICAEGIETLVQLVALQKLGIGLGQGYFLARPGPLPLPTLPIGFWSVPPGSIPPASSPTVDSPPRLLALRATGLLDTPPEESFDQLARIASQLLGAPTVLLSLVDGHRQFFKSAIGLAEPFASRRETPLSYSFCQHAVSSGLPLVIPDTRVHPLVRDNPARTEMHIGAYLGIPLVTARGHALGAFCAMTPEPRTWSAGDLGTMQELAALAVRWIDLRSSIRQGARPLQRSER